MPVDLNLVNTKILMKGQVLTGGLSIENGKLFKIGKEANLPSASQKLDVKGLLVLPGLIDVHVHLRDMQLAYKEDFYSGTCAAAAGGFTSVLDMPNTQPMTNSVSNLHEKINVARSGVITNVGFYASPPSIMTEVEKLAQDEIIGFKISLAYSWTDLNLNNDEILDQLISKISEYGRIVAIHAEDKIIIENLKKQLIKESRNSINDFLLAHSENAEIQSVKRVLRIIKKLQRIHFCHLSCAESIRHVVEARKNGFKVSCEVTPHHLFLSENTIRKLGAIALTDPPLRSKVTIEKIQAATVQGFVNVVASDHAPHTMNEKNRVNVWEIPPGFPGLETTLSLLLTSVNKGNMSLQNVVELLAENPSKIFNLKSKGKIEASYDADLTVIDLKRDYKIDSSKFHSKAKYSPFENLNVKGKAVKTFVAGNLVIDDGEVLAKPGLGKILKEC